MTSRVTDPIANLQALVRCPSVTPADAGALGALEAQLKELGFATHRMTFSEDGTPDIENLYGRLGDSGPHLMFAGHTDVVPPGDEASWTHAPFEGEIADGVIYGRGTVDMKGGIACFVAALARHVERHGKPAGSVSLLITGDEEGPAINGTSKLLEWATARGERWDACILGEPTNPNEMGDMIKIGRRGSLSGTVTVTGVQGHVAYPHLADNPIPGLLDIADALLAPLDEGTADFQPSNLEITSFDTGNPAANVIPAKCSLAFNVRFNDRWTPETLRAEILRRAETAATNGRLRADKDGPARFEVAWRDRPSPVFLTRDPALVDVMAGAVEAVTGRTPALSTSGGTSDARFIKDYCPVVEFGLVGKTMHMVDERAALSDIETLTRIYEQAITDWFAGKA